MPLTYCCRQCTKNQIVYKGQSVVTILATIQNAKDINRNGSEVIILI